MNQLDLYDIDELECEELPVSLNDGRSLDDVDLLTNAFDCFALSIYQD